MKHIKKFNESEGTFKKIDVECLVTVENYIELPDPNGEIMMELVDMLGGFGFYLKVAKNINIYETY